MSTVVGFAQGYTSSGVLKWCTASLSCGHAGKVRMMPRRGRCCNCGQVADLAEVGSTFCACGSVCWEQIWFPDVHNENHYLTRIGDTVECRECADESESLERLRAVDAATVHHARFKTWCGRGVYHLYRLDATSPSMFMLLFSVPAIPAVEQLLREKRICALSPTEAA